MSKQIFVAVLQSSVHVERVSLFPLIHLGDNSITHIFMSLKAHAAFLPLPRCLSSFWYRYWNNLVQFLTIPIWMVLNFCIFSQLNTSNNLRIVWLLVVCSYENLWEEERAEGVLSHNLQNNKNEIIPILIHLLWPWLVKFKLMVQYVDTDQNNYQGTHFQSMWWMAVIHDSRKTRTANHPPMPCKETQ